MIHATREQFSTNLCFRVREIKISEECSDEKTGKKKIIVEGIVNHLPNERLVAPTYSNTRGCQNVSENCHPLCRFNFVHEIKHTDVLILRQFMENGGQIISREITGLCRRQHTRMSKLIKMAAKAGLFPEKQDIFRAEKEKLPATRFNSYYDESTIDIQHRELERKSKIKTFKK